MEKILGYYDRVKDWLCGFGSDKYLHLLAGLVVSFVSSTALGHSWAGLSVALAVGLAKELTDRYAMHRDFSWEDVIFTVIGGVIGTLMYLI